MVKPLPKLRSVWRYLGPGAGHNENHIVLLGYGGGEDVWVITVSEEFTHSWLGEIEEFYRCFGEIR